MSTVDLPRIVTLARSPRSRRAARSQAAAFVVLTGLSWALLSLAWPRSPVHIHVRWKPDVTDAERVALERGFQLTDGVRTEGTTWEYQLVDSSSANIRVIIQHGQVEDTGHLNRIRYRPEFAQDRLRQTLVYAVAIGAVGSILWLILGAGAPRPVSFRLSSLPESSEPAPASAGPTPLPTYGSPTIAATLGAGILVCIAMTSLASARFWSAAIALGVVYGGGYAVGWLLVPRVEGWSLAIIRTIAGLLLTTTAFLLSLVLSLPWFAVPGLLLGSVVFLRVRTALAWPQVSVRFTWDGLAAGILAAILLSPIVITFFYMAPGSFPPAFYHVDTAYSLEKVHALVIADAYPPESLGNVGVRRTYQYGTQAMAALISRSSGLAPHHSLFLIVLPLLTSGVVAAALAISRYVSPALPRSVTVPLLLISAPTLTRSFWDKFGSQLWSAATSQPFSIDAVVGDYRIWGMLSNEAQTVGAGFLILGTVAGMAAAPYWGWRLPAFLVGVSILVKTPTGIALVAGFALAESWQAVVARRLRPSRQALMTGAICIATFVIFFLASFDSVFRVEMYPLFHLRDIVGRDSRLGFLLDALWLFLPVLIILTARITDPERRSAPILLLAGGPFLVLNTTILAHTGQGGGGSGDEWVQILHPAPFLLHAFALSLASRRWVRLGRARRAAFLVTVALMIVPVTIAAGRYSFLLLHDRTMGSEFVDNRALAEALAVIPTRGTLIVTNDLRYPAENFSRDDRQLQVPALFGHQAFAVNFSYEPVEHRRGVQRLLQQTDWSDAILHAARTHHWTHLVIRKDYVHPVPIPLEQTFENQFYAVFRFP